MTTETDYLKRAIEAQQQRYEDHQTMHLLHFIIFLFTGLWGFVWAGI